jgi:hypothetical protein
MNVSAQKSGSRVTQYMISAEMIYEILKLPSARNFARNGSLAALATMVSILDKFKQKNHLGRVRSW